MSTRRMTSPFFIPIDFAFVSSPCLSVSHSGCATPFVPSGDECGMCLSRRCFFLAVAFAIAPCPFRNKKIMFDKPAFLSPWSDWTPVKMTDVVLCCLSLCPSGSLPDCPDGYTLNGNTCGMYLLMCCLIFSAVTWLSILLTGPSDLLALPPILIPCSLCSFSVFFFDLLNCHIFSVLSRLLFPSFSFSFTFCVFFCYFSSFFSLSLTSVLFCLFVLAFLL